jgi:hypothetical protein
MNRTAALTEARNNVATFRNIWETATTKKARNEAADDLEFWVSRATMLSNEKGWA